MNNYTEVQHAQSRSKCRIQILDMDANNQAKIRTKIICRFCLKIVDEALYLTQNISSEDGRFEINLFNAIADVVPEVNLRLIVDPKICYLCVTFLKSALHFRELCLQSDEELLKMVPTKKSTGTQIKVFSLKQNLFNCKTTKQSQNNSIHKKIDSGGEGLINAKSSPAHKQKYKLPVSNEVNENMKNHSIQIKQNIEKDLSISDIKIEEHELNWPDVKEEIKEETPCGEFESENNLTVPRNQESLKSHSFGGHKSVTEIVSSEKNLASYAIHEIENEPIRNKLFQDLDNDVNSFENFDKSNQKRNLSKPIRTYSRIIKRKAIGKSIEHNLTFEPKRKKIVKQKAQLELVMTKKNVGSSEISENATDGPKEKNHSAKYSIPENVSDLVLRREIAVGQLQNTDISDQKQKNQTNVITGTKNGVLNYLNVTSENTNDVKRVETAEAKNMYMGNRMMLFKKKYNRKSSFTCQFCNPKVCFKLLSSFKKHQKTHVIKEVISLL